MIIQDYYDWKQLFPAIVSFAKRHNVDMNTEDGLTDAIFKMIKYIKSTKESLHEKYTILVPSTVTPWIESRSERGEVLNCDKYVWIDEHAKSRFDKLDDLRHGLSYHYEGFFE